MSLDSLYELKSPKQYKKISDTPSGLQTKRKVKF